MSQRTGKDLDRLIVTGDDITVHRKGAARRRTAATMRPGAEMIGEEADAVPAYMQQDHPHHYHGSPGEPGYPAKHPGGERKGKRRAGGGGWVGSDQVSEEDQIASLTRYIDDSLDINTWLRQREIPSDEMDQDEVEAHVRNMMDLIEIQEPSRFGTVFYRGVRPDAPLNLKVGDEFHDKGFVSMTESRAVARDFSGDEGVIFQINVPEGTKVLNVDSVDATDPMRIEAENILQSGTRFRVVRIKPPTNSLPGGYVLEVVP